MPVQSTGRKINMALLTPSTWCWKKLLGGTGKQRREEEWGDVKTEEHRQTENKDVLEDMKNVSHIQFQENKNEQSPLQGWIPVVLLSEGTDPQLTVLPVHL